MIDIFSKDKHSDIMSKISNKNTKPEILVRKHLFAKGFRFRINDKRFPGKPDILLPKYKTAIFVNGCFWHDHEGCKYYVLPKTNIKFRQNKIEHNRNRDIEERQQLISMGWHCITVWECQLKPKVCQHTLDALEYTLCHIYLENRKIKPHEITGEDYNMVAEPIENYGKSK